MADERDSLIVYASEPVGAFARAILASGCAAVGQPIRLEVMPAGAILRRLFAERGIRSADLLLTLGPYHLLATDEGALQPFQPAEWLASADMLLAAHAVDWRWLSVGYVSFRLAGQLPTPVFDAVTPSTAPRLALVDPSRSEGGMLTLLASLDRARQVDGDPERGWARWARWPPGGLVPLELPDDAHQAVTRGDATHALMLDPPLSAPAGGEPLRGLAPIPIAAAVVKQSGQKDAAQALLGWLAGSSAASAIESAGALSVWRMGQNGLADLARSAPPLDVAWTLSQYRPARQRWAALGLTFVG